MVGLYFFSPETYYEAGDALDQEMVEHLIVETSQPKQTVKPLNGLRIKKKTGILN